MSTNSCLPDYADGLTAFHRSHRDTLKAIIGSLPIHPQDQLIDVATGDGTYAQLMATLGADVLAADIDPQFLSLVEERARLSGQNIKAMEANATKLPLESGTLDGAFCAQSFYSIDDVDGVISEMIRVVRPRGWVGVMENDSLHHVILPWPSELEIEILKAERQALMSQESAAERFYIGRNLSSVMREAGLVELNKRSFATQYNTPLSDDARKFLQWHIQTLVERAAPFLSEENRSWARRLSDSDSSEFLLDAVDFTATVVDFLVWGRVNALESE